MKRLLIILFTLSTIPTYAISNLSRISILTCSPGKDLYSSFGHTALRVVDEYNDLDLVFNYGTFDASQDRFYHKFIDGTLMYFLSVSNYNTFYSHYAEDGREVIEQTLNLSMAEKNIIWDKLGYDYLEENRFYKYDFVTNNCTTKISDIINLISPTYVYQTSNSFRTLLNSVLDENKELRFVLNLLMGNNANRMLVSNENNCLPDIFMNSLDKAQIMTPGGTKPLVVEKRVVLKNTIPVNFFRYDILFFVIIMSIIIYDIILLFYNYPLWVKYTKWVILLPLLISGLLGLLILLLDILHFQLVYPNLNIFWCSPLNLILLPLLFSKNSKFQKWLLLINLLGCLVYVILLFANLQRQDTPVIIFMTLLIVIYCIVLYGNSIRFNSKNRKHFTFQCKN